MTRRPVMPPSADDRERGASPVELAILFPTIMLLLFGSIQVATVFLARSVALNAAQIGVNSTRVLGGASEEDGEAQARQFVDRAGDWLAPTTVDVEKGDVEVNATVSGRALSLIPGLTITVTQTARGPRERFTEDAG
ncbi:TadE/TadG family type IV pilus assembly protein [Micromonospora echinofusca]|nr:pilus assembly protein [Micromonospora echinofusca]